MKVNSNNTEESVVQVVSPDFVICGAMKCGTTSLHHILQSHPNIEIPASEIHSYNQDDIAQHPDFTSFDNGFWSKSQIHNRGLATSAYLNMKKSGRLYGEDSTTYLASERALKRLSNLAVKPKLIVMLRQPSKRAYSHYWHLVNSGRTSDSFETLIMNQPLAVLDRSMYKRQLEVVYKYFSRDEVLIVLFESFVNEPEVELERVAKFLGIEFSAFPCEAITTHSNPGLRRYSTSLLKLKNKLLIHNAFIKYQEKSTLSLKYKFFRYYNYLVNSAHNIVNPLVNRPLPKMNSSTKDFLDNYFIEEFEGINHIIGADVSAVWFSK